ncbi:MAG: hypothetical protein R3D34_14035 [Nitratireductor sp.]
MNMLIGASLSSASAIMCVTVRCASLSLIVPATMIVRLLKNSRSTCAGSFCFSLVSSSCMKMFMYDFLF